MTRQRKLIPAPALPVRSLGSIGETPLAPADRIDLSASLAFFRRRLPLIAGFTIIGLLVGIALSLTADRIYVARSLVSMEMPRMLGVEADPNSTREVPNDAIVETQSEIISSRAMATVVAESLGLLKGVTDDAERSEIVDDVQGGVSALRSGDSYALAIEYEAGDGETASDRVNEYARQFALWDLNTNKGRDAASIKAIESRLEELRGQSQADTAALQNYRIANDLLSTSGSSLTEQEISSYNQEVTSARAQVSEDRARLNTALSQLSSGSSGDDVGEALGSSVVSSLRSQESVQASKVANLASRYGPNYPELVQAKSELAETRASIQAEIGRVVSNLRAKLAVSEQRLGSLTGSLSNAEAKLSQSNRSMVGLQQLQLRADASQGLYDAYLSSYKKLVAGEGLQQPNARVLSLSEVPTLPSSPNIPMNLVLSLVIGFGAGLIAAFLAETFFHGVTTPDDVERITGERYLGSIPLLKSVDRFNGSAYEAITSKRRSFFTESFRSLLLSIHQQGTDNARIVAITSPLPREGKTVTATCLAQILALSGERTLLIDCDYARRGVTRLLNLDGEASGLLDVLQGHADHQKAIIAGSSGLSILPLSARHCDDAETLLMGDNFGQLLSKLRTEYQHIILDLPPVLPIAATRAIAEKADTTVLLARWRKTTGSALQAAIQQLPSDYVNIAGIALTQVDLRRSTQFGKTDPFFYFREYREYLN